LIPIDDDEFVDMDGGLLPTRDELYEIVDQGRFGEGNFGANTVIDSIVDNYKKAPPDFTYCEIYPEVIYTVQPEYPRQARMVGLTATVWVRILVGKNGEALDAAVHVSSGSNAGFDEAAVAAALKCKFKPGIQNGKPVEAWVSLKFEFDLND
jgi:TonB family protein